MPEKIRENIPSQGATGEQKSTEYELYSSVERNRTEEENKALRARITDLQTRPELTKNEREEYLALNFLEGKRGEILPLPPRDGKELARLTIKAEESGIYALTKEEFVKFRELNFCRFVSLEPRFPLSPEEEKELSGLQFVKPKTQKEQDDQERRFLTLKFLKTQHNSLSRGPLKRESAEKLAEIFMDAENQGGFDVLDEDEQHHFLFLMGFRL